MKKTLQKLIGFSPDRMACALELQPLQGSVAQPGDDDVAEEDEAGCSDQHGGSRRL